MQEASTEARKGNAAIKQQVRDIDSKFVNNVEIIAQESATTYKNCTQADNIHQCFTPSEDRVELLKPLDAIKEMNYDCEEIYTNGSLKRYCKHPAKLDHLTLADWVAWYDFSEKTIHKNIK